MNETITNAYSIDWLSALTMLGLVGVLGTFGNLLVIGVYLQHLLWPHSRGRTRQHYRVDSSSNGSTKRSTLRTVEIQNNSNSPPCYRNIQETGSKAEKGQSCSDEQLYVRKTGTPTFFILVLACVDLIVCCFVVPITFYLEFVHMRPNGEFWCKAHAFLSVCNTMFSSLLVIAIALDRYFAICHPLHPILTMRRAKWLTFSLATFCAIYGILAQWTIQLESKNPESQPPECIDTIETHNITLAEMYFYQIIQKGNTACFVLSILFVLILYSLILRVVIKAQRRIERFHKESCAAQHQFNNNDNVSQNDAHTLANFSEEPHGKRTGRMLRTKFSIRGLTDSGLWREIRSASVLFVVAIVYIIVFTPSLLMANNAVPSTLVGYNSYFLNNMSNPLIYCFMSNQFRRKLVTLFTLMCSSRHSSQEDILFTQSRRPDRRGVISGVTASCPSE